MNIYMRYPNGKTKALTLSYDDGVTPDVILVNKMMEHGIKGTFNINTGMFSPPDTIFNEKRHVRMTAQMCYDLYYKNGMEVAVHAYTHPHLETLSDVNCLWEVIKDRKALEDLFEMPIHGMAYPYGTYNDNIVKQLESAGIYYARTTKVHSAFIQPGDWLRLYATAHHNNPNLLTLAESFINDKPDKDPYLFYLWGHSYEFDNNNNWNVIDNFFDKVSGKSDVWYATNIEIYEYTRAYKMLDFSLDCDYVYNPSSKTVWFVKDNRLIEVKSGETKHT